MKVLFDHIVFQIQKIGGVSKALSEMISHLPQDVEAVLGLKESDNLYVRELFPEQVSRPRLTLDTFFGGRDFRGRTRLYETLSSHSLIPSMEAVNMKYCRSLMSEGDYDVFQPTHYNSHFLSYNKKPFVLVVHDIVPELFPSYYAEGFPDIVQRKKLIPLADSIVAISENTKKDILERWDISEEKVSVIHWGAPDVKDVQFRKLLPYDYVLFVGGRTKYKRFDFFVSQARHFLKAHDSIHVVCTGEAFSASERLMLSSFGLEQRFHAMTVSTEDLFSLYHGALCFVFPSEYEGFGLPTLEAMACGCPVLLANKSCFPEIGGDAAFYFDSDSSGDSNLAERLDYITGLSADERQAVSENCRHRAGEFSWTETARRYADVYRSLLM